MDTALRMRANLKIFSPCSAAQVIIATTKLAPAAKMAYFKSKAQIIVDKNRGNRVDLRDLLQKLARQQFAHILIEGGGEIIASALKMKLVDRMIMVVASKIIGGRYSPTAVEGKGISRIRQAARLEDMKFRRLGPDLIIEGRPR